MFFMSTAIEELMFVRETCVELIEDANEELLLVTCVLRLETLDAIDCETVVAVEFVVVIDAAKD
jgi:hypothetical protein